MKRLLMLALALACGLAQAQGYPNRAVRVIVAAQTGGPDIVARVVAAELQAQTGQAFVVENQGGANGIVGATTVAKAAPDGYTLLVYSSGFVINPAVHKTMPYDTEKDFTPVTNLVSNGGLFFAVDFEAEREGRPPLENPNFTFSAPRRRQHELAAFFEIVERDQRSATREEEVGDVDGVVDDEVGISLVLFERAVGGNPDAFEEWQARVPLRQRADEAPHALPLRSQSVAPIQAAGR